jgi:hypothetical protein
LALSNLLRRSWFSRIWVLQEVALAKDIWIYCGNQRTTWNAFSGVLHALKMKSKLSSDYRAAWNLATFRRLYKLNKAQGGVDIYAAMVQARQCQASDLRDKIYALLGVCQELARRVGKPDYGEDVSVAMVWTRAQRSCLASYLSINALSLVSIGERLIDDIPSWVADLSDDLKSWPRRPPSAVPTDGMAMILPCPSTTGYCLHPWGTFADSIIRTFGYKGSRTLKDNMAQWRGWWTQFKDLNSTTGLGDKEMIFAFWSTLYCDVKKSVPHTNKALLWHSCITGKGFFEEDDDDSILTEDIEVFPGVRAKDLVESTSKKVFGVTQAGSMGLFPHNARVGDQIVLFSGGTIPYIIRRAARFSGNSELLYAKQIVSCMRRGENAYNLIGPCYVLGMMDEDERARDPKMYDEILLY